MQYNYCSIGANLTTIHATNATNDTFAGLTADHRSLTAPITVDRQSTLDSLYPIALSRTSDHSNQVKTSQTNTV